MPVVAIHTTGHLSRWFALPWCADSEKVKAATTAQEDEATIEGTGPKAVCATASERTGCRRGASAGKSALALKPISRDTDGLPMKLAQRQLLAFPATPEEVEATRLAVLYGCC